MSSIARQLDMTTQKYVRGPVKKGLYNKPELQLYLRHMTNYEVCQWHRAKCPTKLDDAFFDAPKRRIKQRQARA